MVGKPDESMALHRHTHSFEDLHRNVVVGRTEYDHELVTTESHHGVVTPTRIQVEQQHRNPCSVAICIDQCFMQPLQKAGTIR